MFFFVSSLTFEILKWVFGVYGKYIRESIARAETLFLVKVLQIQLSFRTQTAIAKTLRLAGSIMPIELRAKRQLYLKEFN